MGNNLAGKCVEKMLEKDAFSNWLGIKILKINQGQVNAQMVVRKEMINGFGAIQGGVLFSFADSVFAFSCNTYNNLSVALNCSISYPKPAYKDDVLIAKTKEQDITNKTGCYDVTIYNQKEEIVARFRGIAYRTGKKLIQEK